MQQTSSASISFSLINIKKIFKGLFIDKYQ